MTETQRSNREERLAIMMTEGATMEDAEAFCDSCPELYGVKK